MSVLTNSSAKPRVLPPVKPPRIIVEHFDIGTYKVDQTKGYVEANCRHCGATIRGQRNVTSNFIQHMRRRHPDAYEEFAAASTHRAKRPRLTSSKLPTTTNPVPPPAAAATPPPPTQPHVYEQPRPTPRPKSQGGEKMERTRSDFALENALISATYRAAKRTPCDLAPGLSERTGCRVYVKREDQQVAGSTIFRAAYNHLAVTPTSRSGLVAAGQAALPVAMAAQMHSKSCLVVLPTSSPPQLLRKLTSCDAKYELAGDNEEHCIEHAIAKAIEMNRTFVDLTTPNLITDCSDAAAGYATVALELLQQRQHIDRIFLAGGHGPLFMGVSSVLQRLGRGVKLIGVVLDTAEGVPGARAGDNGAVGSQDRNKWYDFAESVVQVNQSELCAAVKAVFEDCDGSLLEPSGVLSVAGAIKYSKTQKLSHERIVCVVDSPLRQFDLLRMVTGRSWRADGSQCLLNVDRRELDKPNANGAAFKSLMTALEGMADGQIRITSLRYAGKWPILLGLSCNSVNTVAEHITKLETLGYCAADLTDSDLTEDSMWTWEKDMGSQGNVQGEGNTRWAVFRVELQNRTNAVANFLASMQEECPLRKVSYSHDGGNAARLLVAANGTEAQLRALETQMVELAERVERITTSASGVSILGCVDLGMPVANGHVACDADMATDANSNGPASNEVRSEAHRDALEQTERHETTVQHTEDKVVPTGEDEVQPHHHEHVEHVGNGTDHDVSLQDHDLHQSREQTEEAPPHDSDNQQALHQQHEVVQHEATQHDSAQEVVHSEQLQQDEPQNHDPQQEGPQDELPQHENAHDDTVQHSSSQHDQAHHDDIDQKDAEHHDAEHEQQTCDVQLEEQHPTSTHGDATMAEHEAENEATELAISFPDGEGEVAVPAPPRELDEAENEVARQHETHEEVHAADGDAQLQHSEHAGGDGGETDQGQQDADVEMQDDVAIHGDPEVIEVNSQSQVDVQEDDDQNAEGAGTHVGEEVAQNNEVEHVEDHEVVEESVMEPESEVV